MDSIDGLSPAISIEQKTTSRSPRSTVGTITEIYDYLRVLYASIGMPHCPNCGNEISRQTTDQILQQVLALGPQERVMILAPIVRGRKGEYKKELEKLARQGFVRARIDGVLRSLDEEITLDQPQEPHHRSGGGPAADQAGDREAPGSFDRDGDQAGRWAGAGRGGERRGAAVLAEAGVPGLRRERSAAGAALVFLQQPLRRVRNVHGPGQPVGFDPVKVIVDPSRPLLDGGLGPGGSSSYMTQRSGASWPPRS